jgi:hypothetical protein
MWSSPFSLCNKRSKGIRGEGGWRWWSQGERGCTPPCPPQSASGPSGEDPSRFGGRLSTLLYTSCPRNGYGFHGQSAISASGSWKMLPLPRLTDWSVCLLTLKHVVSLQSHARPSVQAELDLRILQLGEYINRGVGVVRD